MIQLTSSNTLKYVSDFRIYIFRNFDSKWPPLTLHFYWFSCYATDAGDAYCFHHLRVFHLLASAMATGEVQIGT